MTDEHLNTEGLVEVGELGTRLFREALVATDFRNAHIGGAVDAYTATAFFVRGKLEAAGPFDDTRTMRELLIWLGDRIREVQSPATEEANATQA